MRGRFVVKMAAGWSVSSLWSFHDTEQVMVSAELLDGRLVVKVEEKLTADQWRGQFDQKREATFCIFSHVLAVDHSGQDTLA